MRKIIIGVVAAYVVILAFSSLPDAPPKENRTEDANAKLDREIAAGLARDGVYIPSPPAPNPGDPGAMWTAGQFTMACSRYADAEAFAFLAAMGNEADLVNPYSDPSQTSCRHVAPGDQIRRIKKVGDAGLVEVMINGRGPTFIVDDHVVPRK